MVTVPQTRYWPYDEVSASRDRTTGRFIFTTPWLTADIGVESSDAERAEAIVSKIGAGTLGADDLGELTWLFSSLSQYSLAYILPGPAALSAPDRHALADRALLEASPAEILARLAGPTAARVPAEWKWDVDAALAFSTITPGAHDPASLFSVFRRFHLLESVESNQTDVLLERSRARSGDPERFREISALLVRQNQYVTQKCDYALRPALEIAQGARAGVQAFIRAEAGHDVILQRAMTALGESETSVPALDAPVALMEVFHQVARRNFLAFAMIVDMFERSSYRDEDPLAGLLLAGGQEKAGRQIDIHREINDSGGHENVALGFLAPMAAVDADYAREALRLAELVTDLLHGISAGLIEKLGLE